MSMIKCYDTIICPIITEKSMQGIPNLTYTFKVRKSACKFEIRIAIEKIFGVKVSKVNTMNVRGRSRRRGRIYGVTPSWKKAIVTLAPGEKSIDFFNQVT